MKISEDLLGKEVLDESGDKIGDVEDVDWDLETNAVEDIVLKKTGISGKIGLGENIIIPYNQIKTIGDKVIIRNRVLEKE